MSEPEMASDENANEISRRIDRRIKPWLWGLVLGIVFAFFGVFAILSDIDIYGKMSDATAGYALYCFLFGALFGALAAYGARNIVKAIRC